MKRTARCYENYPGGNNCFKPVPLDMPRTEGTMSVRLMIFSVSLLVGVAIGPLPLASADNNTSRNPAVSATRDQHPHPRRPHRSNRSTADPPDLRHSCGNGVTEAGEECDDGGTCIGGSNAGTHCTAESQCIGNGVCIGGYKAETACDPTNPDACPGGTCKKCVPQGGDGCASNCTTETTVQMPLVPG